MNAAKRLNLFPAEDRIKTEGPVWRTFLKKNPVLLRFLAAAAVVLVLAAGYKQLMLRLDPAYLRLRINELRDQQEALSLQIEERTNALLARRAQLLNARETLEDQLRALSQPQRSQAQLSNVLLKLVDAVPESIWVSELRYATSSLSIIGSTEDAKSVSTLMQRLDNAPAFGQTVFRYTQRETDEKEDTPRYSFEVNTLPISGPEPGELLWKN